MVKVATVPRTSASRSGCIWSMDWHTRQTRVGRQVAEAADRAAAGGEGVLPALGAVHDRRARALGIGAPGRLAVELAPPGQEGGVGEVGPARGHLLGHRRDPGGPARRLGRRQGVGGAQHQGVGAVGQRQHHDDLARRGPLEHVGQGQPGLGRPEVAHRAGQVGRHGLRRPRRARPVTALTARAWSPATMAWSTSLSVTPASLRASAKASRASGTYISSPKRSSQTWESASPGTRQRSRNSSLAERRAR